MSTTPEPDRPDPGPEAPRADGSFFTWLRDLGIVRGSDRWFAGVAGGIAVKAGIDPLIVRGVFVVLALLGGPGLLIYLAGWLLLPDSRGRIHVEDIFRGRAETWVLVTAIVLAAVLVIPALVGLVATGVPLLGTPGFWGWDLWGALGVPGWLTRTVVWLFWIAVLVVGFIWLRGVVLKRGRERAAGDDPGAASGGASGATASEQERSFAERSEEFANRTAQQATDWGQSLGERANRWSEDVGRQADEWSARYAEHHDAHRLGAAQTILTLALALLAAGFAGFWVLGLDSAPSVASVAPAPVVAGLIAALAVLALSLIIAGVRGRHTGWVGFLSTCGVFVLLIVVVLPWGTRFQPFGDVHVDGLSGPGAVVIGGNADVDLRPLDDNPGERGELEIWQLAGNATVILPESRPTEVRVRVLAGNISERGTARDGMRISGPFLSTSTGVGLERIDDASSDDSVARVTVYLLAGNVRVEGSETESSRGSSIEERRRYEEERRELEEEQERLREELEELEQEMAR